MLNQTSTAEKTRTGQKGMTLIETLVVVAIVGVIIPTILSFLWGAFNLNRRTTSAIFNQQNARRIIDKLKSDLREINTGQGNQYPLAICGEYEISYFSDTDQDGAVEKIRYFLSGTDLKKGIIEPSGTSYPAGNEQIKTLLRSVSYGNATMFSYYNQDYQGTETALAQPVSCQQVRAVGIELALSNATEPFQISTLVQLRNLKNNF